MQDKKQKNRNFFTDIWRKVIALLLAILAWWAIHRHIVNDLPVEEVRVPLRIVCADRRVVLPEKTTLVTLKVKNPTLLDKISQENFDVVYTLNATADSIPGGGKTVLLTRSRKYTISKPPFTKIVGIDVDSSILVDKMVTKQVSVEVKSKGTPAYEMVPHLEVSPQVVLIEGPSVELENIHKVSLEDIDVTGLEQDNSFGGNVRPLPKKVRFKEGSEPKFNVDVKLSSGYDIEDYTLNVPLSVLYPVPQRNRIADDKNLSVTLTFMADSKTINGIKSMEKNLRPYLDLSTFPDKTGEIEAHVILDLPGGMSGRGYKLIKEPSMFKVKLVPLAEKSEKKEDGNGD